MLVLTGLSACRVDALPVASDDMGSDLAVRIADLMNNPDGPDIPDGGSRPDLSIDANWASPPDFSIFPDQSMFPDQFTLTDLATTIDQTILRDQSRFTDLASAADQASSPDMASFCGDPNSGRIELNGMLAASPVVNAYSLPLNCCDAAEVDLQSAQIATPIVVMCRHQVGQGPNPPVTLDLANLPPGWSVTVMSGCLAMQPACVPTDVLSTGLTGTLTISGNPLAYQMSLCLDGMEDPVHPQPVIHSIKLWTGVVTTK